MTSTIVGTQSQREYRPRDATDAASGWYFYGITLAGSPGAVSEIADVQQASDNGSAALQLFEYSGIAAVVRAVLLDNFTPSSLSQRLRNGADLESMVRQHNQVVEVIHRRHAILPSKFGVVYTRAEEIVSALGAGHDSLLRQLHRLQGCDEWAVHVYADESVVREHVSATEPGIRRLRDQMAVARPGRAYFLEQQLRDEVRAVTEQELSICAQTVFDRLSTLAADCLASPVHPSSDRAPEVEILRASFLVSRDLAERFQSEVLLACDDTAGMRCEVTGPWPPYSFAAEGQEVGNE